MKKGKKGKKKEKRKKGKKENKEYKENKENRKKLKSVSKNWMPYSSYSYTTTVRPHFTPDLYEHYNIPI